MISSISTNSEYPAEGKIWSFFNPVEITIGRGCRNKLIDRLTALSLLVVTTKRGRKQFSEDFILKNIEKNNNIIWIDSVQENPSVDDLQEIIDVLSGRKFDAVIGFGGGSSIDSAKAINVALAPECLGKDLRQLLEEPALHAHANPSRLFTIPTTSGTGSEVTPFATLWDYQKKKKLSLASKAVWPTAAFVDPALTDSLPENSTLATGLDAINQAAESIWNKNANPITLAYAQRALQLGFESLPRLMNGIASELDRDQMAEASLLAGLAISHTRTALCHSISYPITAHFNVPHGLACAFTMVSVLKCNLQEDDGRFEYLAIALTGTNNIKNLVCRFEILLKKLNVRLRIKEYIPSIDELLAFEPQMLTSGRFDNNLVKIENIKDILIDSWGIN